MTPSEVVIDFETVSKADLSKTGAFAYAQDETTRIVCMAWCAVDGSAEGVWQPGEPFPEPVEAAAREGRLVAHNAAFEYAIWQHVLRKSLFRLPALQPGDISCTMARAAYAGYPMALVDAAAAVGLEMQKDPAGKKLIQFSQRLYKRTGSTEPPPGLLAYALQDARAEAELHRKLPPLPEREQRIYRLDAAINARGILLDTVSAKAVKRMVEEEITRARALLAEITGGEVNSVNEVAKMLAWLRRNGLPDLSDLRAETVAKVLKSPPPSASEAAMRVLEIRADAAGSAVKKIDTMLACVGADGRMRGLLQYYGAPTTGRWAGRLVQPQNLPRPETGEVDPEDFQRLPGEGIKAVYGSDLLSVAKSALRRLLWAAPGKVLVRADLQAIEARLVFWLAGEQKALQLYRQNADIYCDMASKVFGRPITKEHREERFVGKVLVLGCFGPDTLVLTDRGWVRIVDVTKEMKVWDGVRWTAHGGVIARGERETIQHLGVWATPDHRVWTGKRWVQWGVLARSASMSRQALATASATLPLLAWNAAPRGEFARFCADATAETLFLSMREICGMAAAARAARAAGVRLRRSAKSGGTTTLTSVRIVSKENDFFAAYTRPWIGATTRSTQAGKTMGGAASRFGRSGVKIGKPLWFTYSLSRGGMTLRFNLTGSTTTEGMNPATYGSSRHNSTTPTAEPSGTFNEKTKPCGKRMQTYDIALSGPRRRFVIWSAGGPLLVHNCGYGMGSRKLQGTLEALGGRAVDDLTAGRYVEAYRSAWPHVVAAWRELEHAAKCAYGAPGRTIAALAGLVAFQCVGCSTMLVRLPSGRVLFWHNVAWDYEEQNLTTVRAVASGAARGTRQRLYGGALLERITQATARDVMAEAMLAAEANGLPIVLTVHDEIVCEVPENAGAAAAETLVGLMRTPPAWAEGLPLDAEAEHERRYGK